MNPGEAVSSSGENDAAVTPSKNFEDVIGANVVANGVISCVSTE
jgi:hypothetical protein